MQIIGPKPCFGADGTIFDTSVENFHFKVPSGVLIVNGQKYALAELDGNPDDGYELVVPEVKGKLGWSKNADGGFVYKRPADNNPDVMGGLTLYGKDLVDDGTGKPDGVEVKTIIIGQEPGDGHRWTKIGIEGLHGEVFLNHPEAIHSFGVKGDGNYNIYLDADAVTAELVQKVLGTDTQDASKDSEIQPPAENLSDTRAPELWNVEPSANETSSDDKQISIEIPAVELFDASELFGVSDKIIEPQEKNRSDTSDASDLEFKEILGLQFEEILPVKNNGADFVLDKESELNMPLATFKQELKIQGSEMDRQ